jgi:non-ribosomal peptide synthetase component F
MIGVNEELNFDHVVVRDTGDMVRIHNNNIYYIGRKDQQMKRNGRRMNLEEIKMVT